MSHIIYIAIAIIALILILTRNYKKNNSNINLNYEKKDDINAQKKYENIKLPQKEELSLQEKTELSWKFLYDIADTILKKFTKEDKEELKKIGTVLLQHGMNYNHEIDKGITPKSRQHELQHQREQKSQTR